MNYNKNVKENIECTVERTLEVIGNKWTTLILRDLLHGTKRFGELRNNLSGISPKTLTDRLRYLEEQGVLTRKIHPEIPPKVEYSLTKKGKDLGKIIAEMSKWGEMYTSS
jgi:DNA-binding HxlR family transcriptional regulator